MSQEQFLTPYVDSTVAIITNDGRQFVGVLRGFDQAINLILEDCQERIYRGDEGAKTESLGLHIVRGDNVAIVGEIDEEIDSGIDWEKVFAGPLKPVTH